MILFLCSGNYYRSRFAESYFNDRAASLGLPVRAVSRGFRLGENNVGPISPHARRGLERHGIVIDADVRSPLAVVEDDFCTAARIICLKESEHRPMLVERFPHWEARVEFWQIDDVDCATPEQALPLLTAQLDRLLDDFVCEEFCSAPERR